MQTLQKRHLHFYGGTMTDYNRTGFRGDLIIKPEFVELVRLVSSREKGWAALSTQHPNIGWLRQWSTVDYAIFIPHGWASRFDNQEWQDEAGNFPWATLDLENRRWRFSCCLPQKECEIDKFCHLVLRYIVESVNLLQFHSQNNLDEFPPNDISLNLSSSPDVPIIAKSGQLARKRRKLVDLKP